MDGWQAQVLGRVLGSAEVWMHSPGLTGPSVRSAHMTPVDDPARAVEEALALRAGATGRPARLCVLPHGPLTVATASRPESTGGRAERVRCARHPCPDGRPGIG